MQIRETIAELHAVDIIWGVGNSANVLGDVSGNAWVTGFGGDCTES